MIRRCKQCNIYEQENRSSTNGYKKECPTCGADIHFTSHEQYLDWLSDYLKKQKLKFSILSSAVTIGIAIIIIGLYWLIDGGITN